MMRTNDVSINNHSLVAGLLERYSQLTKSSTRVSERVSEFISQPIALEGVCIMVKKICIAALVTMLLSILLSCGGVGYIYLAYFKNQPLPPLSLFEEEEIFRVFPFSARVFGKNSKHNELHDEYIGEYYINERRWFIAKTEVRQLHTMVDALLATEDRYFFSHPGVNPVAILTSTYDHYVRRRPWWRVWR
jgi:membrane peptidoglycan carboxypeptidase